MHCGSTWWGQGGCLQPDSCLWCGLKYYFPQSAKDKVKRMSASAWLKHYVSPMLFLQMSTEMLHLQMSKMIEQCCTACQSWVLSSLCVSQGGHAALASNVNAASAAELPLLPTALDRSCSHHFCCPQQCYLARIYPGTCLLTYLLGICIIICISQP